jgi:hypothetical protein
MGDVDTAAGNAACLPGETIMKVLPRLLVVPLLATFVSSGCRTAGVDPATRMPPVSTRPGFRIDEFVERHNSNAKLIHSLEARPSITATYGPPGKTSSGHVDGRLAVERPRNFKLELLSHLRSPVADIGSNDQRFWFWMQNRQDRSVYVCDYADLETTSLAVTYQPDWIVASLGLKELSPDEVAEVRIRPAGEPEATALHFPRRFTSGQSYSQVLVVSNATGRPLEYRLLADDGKTVLARALIRKYREFELPSSTGDAEASPTCYLPESFVLEWKREQLALDVALRDVRVNQFDPTRRVGLFTEPTPSGYNRVNLAEVSRNQGLEGQTRIRETLPIPESRSRVRLSPPLQIGDGNDSASLPSADPQTAAVSTAWFRPLIDEVIGAPQPPPPSLESDQFARATWAAAPAGYEQ